LICRPANKRSSVTPSAEISGCSGNAVQRRSIRNSFFSLSIPPVMK
jgi:hypothetical protein